MEREIENGEVDTKPVDESNDSDPESERDTKVNFAFNEKGN